MNTASRNHPPSSFLIFLISILLSAWVLWTKLFSGDAVPGWASSVLPMYLLGGIQLLSLGVIGEYIAKIYMETKRRPRFIIDEIIQAFNTVTPEST